MHRAIRPVFLAGSLISTGCGDDVTEESTESAEGTASAGSGTAMDGDPVEMAPVAVCASEVFVGRVGPGQTCGDHGGWTGTALGDVGILAEFCEYAWSGNDAPDNGDLPGPDDGVLGLVESCPRVVPQADPFSSIPTLRESIFHAFMTAIGRVSPLQGEGPRPRLYIVDTIPESLLKEQLVPNEPHGKQLRALAEGILCAGLSPWTCPVAIINTLGLPRVPPVLEDRERGGVYGTLFDLARGVDDAVRDWENNGDRVHLVLALAVGWEPIGPYGPALQGKTLDQLLAPGGAAADAQAVLAALTRALCHDAVIIAAVGNATGEPCAQTGAVGPAIFQGLLAPTTAQCKAAGFAHDTLINDGADFLVSTSHIGLTGQPLANVRNDALAGLKAQGAVFSGVEDTSGMMTGSSVATTVGAAAAAAVWAVYPELTRLEVLASLREGTAPTTGVRICGALEYACGKILGKAACGPFVCPTPDANAAAVDAVAGEIASALDVSCKANQCPKQLDLGAPFGDSQTLGKNDCGTSTTLWPSVMLPPVTLPPVSTALPLPWAEPQPKKPFCPTCSVKLADDLSGMTVGLSLAALPKNPHPLLIEVVTATGVEFYPINPAKLISGSAGVNLVSIRPVQPWPEVLQVRLSYHLQNVDGSWYRQSEPLMRSPRCGKCMSAPSLCGNGKVEPGEVCDDGDGEACSADCSEMTTPAVCGDGILQKSEVCDDGNTVDGDACSPDCDAVTLPAVCGDGKQEGDESCDDGNVNPGDGCEPYCTLTPPVCGNGKVEGGEVCDDGAQDDGDECSADCQTVTTPAVCGDGEQEGDEQCDDGNDDDYDGCEATCTLTPPECGNGKIEQGEACDDGNQNDGGPGDFCKNDCTLYIPPTCQAPAKYAVCDAALNLADKKDLTSAHKAMGICNDQPANSVQIADFSFNSNNGAAWQVAKGFGTYKLDDDMDPQTPDQLYYSPREGEAFLLISTGAIKAPNPEGVVVEVNNTQGGNGDNGNDDSDALPAPFRHEVGSNNGAGGTPFHHCDGVTFKDCSDTLQAQWIKGNSNPNDKLWFTFTTKVPEGTFGYNFDFVFCSSEWPAWVNTAFNDLLIAYQVDPAAADPMADPPVDPYSGNIAFIPDPNNPMKGLPLTITALDPYFKGPGFTGNEAPLAGTGFETHACSEWFTAEGVVRPGSEVTIGFLLADMQDSILATMTILDNFRWDCEGCVPSEVDKCGVQLPP